MTRAFSSCRTSAILASDTSRSYTGCRSSTCSSNAPRISAAASLLAREAWPRTNLIYRRRRRGMAAICVRRVDVGGPAVQRSPRNGKILPIATLVAVAPPTIKLSDRGRADARRARPRAPAPRTTTPNSSARRRFEINFASSKGRHELAQMWSQYQQRPYRISEMGTFFGIETDASIDKR